MKKTLLICSLFLSLTSFAKEAPGNPGITPTWSNAKKVQVGSSFYDFKSAPKSLVWFSVAQGVLTETYFPTIDKAQIKDSQILILDKNGELIDEKKEMTHETVVLSPSLVKLINRSKDGLFEIHHTYYTGDDASILIDEIEIHSKQAGAEFYVLTNSALKNSGTNDSALVANGGLKFFQDDQEVNVRSTVGFDQLSVGFVGVSDGYQDLKRNQKLSNYTSALNGNVAGIGRLKLNKNKGIHKFYVTYEFKNKNHPMNDRNRLSDTYLSKQKVAYEKRWGDYFKSLKQPEGKSDRDLFYRSMYVLKTHEDKLNPGAMIASLSVPWGEEMRHSEGYEYGGYHLIWPRDLFHVSLAALYSGDDSLALRALRYLKRIQYKTGVWNYGERVIPKKGAFPQNVWTNGEEYWGGLQLDQVAYPIHLFWHLYKDANTSQKAKLLNEFRGMLLSAFDFIVKFGPWTGQERWEENFGISPSSFAAAASALLVGEKIFNNQKYKEIANQWLYKPNDNIHKWTFTTNGVYGDGNYYVRIGGCENYISSWEPNSQQTCIVANSGHRLEQTEMLDQGFLKLSLFGLVSPKDWRIQTSLNKIKEHIQVVTPKGAGHYRYSYDAYGEEKKGRLWPLLNGEHGRFYIEEANASSGAKKASLMEKANYFKQTFKNFKNDGHLIPEQVFESNGNGTGGATPLAWSHAEYIKLLWSIEGKSNIANPLND